MELGENPDHILATFAAESEGLRRQDHSAPLADEGKVYIVEEQYQRFIYSVNPILWLRFVPPYQ
jgi:hypothetical protein